MPQRGFLAVSNFSACFQECVGSVCWSLRRGANAVHLDFPLLLVVFRYCHLAAKGTGVMLILHAALEHASLLWSPGYHCWLRCSGGNEGSTKTLGIEGQRILHDFEFL